MSHNTPLGFGTRPVLTNEVIISSFLHWVGFKRWELARWAPFLPPAAGMVLERPRAAGQQQQLQNAAGGKRKKNQHSGSDWAAKGWAKSGSAGAGGWDQAGAFGGATAQKLPQAGLKPAEPLHLLLTAPKSETAEDEWDSGNATYMVTEEMIDKIKKNGMCGYNDLMQRGNLQDFRQHLERQVRWDRANWVAEFGSCVLPPPPFYC